MWDKVVKKIYRFKLKNHYFLKLIDNNLEIILYIYIFFLILRWKYVKIFLFII